MHWRMLLLFALLAGLLMGCAGSGTDPGSTGGAITDATRSTVLASVQEETKNLTFANFDAERDRILAALRAKPEFKSVELVPDTLNTIQAEFTDGRILIVSRNRPPDSVPASLPTSTRAPGYALPGQARANCIWTFGSPNYGNSTVKVIPALQAAGYNVAAASTVGTLDEFSNLAESGIVFVESHGTVYQKNGTNESGVAIQSGSEKSPELESQYKADLDAKNLVYMNCDSDTPPRYGMTAGFFQKYVKPAPESLIFLNTCCSASLPDVATALLDNGAGAVLGWSNSVEDQDALESAYFLFDQLLGTATLAGHLNLSAEAPKTWQQAFDRGATIIRPANPKKTLNDSYKPTKLKVFGRDGALGTIRPSIESAIVSTDQKTLVLSGRFGFKPGTVVGNPDSSPIPLAVKSWGAAAVTTAWDDRVKSLQATANNLRSNVFSFSGTYRVSGELSGVFESKETIIFSVAGQEVYQGQGPGQVPFTFTASPGQSLRVTVKSTQTYGGPGELWMRTPSGFQYRFVARALDYIPNAFTQVCFDQSFQLQP